ncbi:hypothetical protein BaRGS_00020717 [Batillaria attramentaria]|uniref:Chitin-binding type-2 domain-containing protein n=1 Tax=Batillaria attramentaria TaxID=370345 RepID=A0ABD0KLM7_9CAEN
MAPFLCLMVTFVTVFVTFNPVTLTYGEVTTASIDLTQPLPAGYPNPCTPQHIQHQHLYWAYPPDRNKFIQCDGTGHAYLQACAEHQRWNQREQTCVEHHNNPQSGTTINPGSTTPAPANPCTPEAEAAGNQFFPVPCDHTRFIQCGVAGNHWVQDCPRHMFFDPSINICVTADPQHTDPACN